MAVKLQSDQYESILRVLKENIPDSITVYSITKSLVEGIPSGFQVWVDKIPNPATFVVIADRKTCTNLQRKSYIFVYSKSDESLYDILRTLEVVDFRHHLLFFAIPKANMMPIYKQFPDQNILREETGLLFQATSTSQIKDIPMPKGFHCGEFSRDIADVMASRWDYSGEGVAENIYDTYKWGLPVLVVYNDKQEAVAWVMRHLAGVLTHLYVDVPYRRRGLGSAILSIIAKMVIERDGFVHSFVLIRSKMSISLHENVGFEKVVGKRSFCSRPCIKTHQI